MGIFSHVEGRVRSAVSRARELLERGDFAGARKAVEAVAVGHPLIAFDVFEEEAKRAVAAGRRWEWAFWVEAMGTALSVVEIAPFPPPGDWLEDEKTIALGIAVGKVRRFCHIFVAKRRAAGQL